MRFVTGIDIGSANVRVLVTEVNGRTLKPKALIKKASQGIRHGYIINERDAILALKDAVNEAEEIIKEPIRNAVVSVGGTSLGMRTEENTVAISRADGEITDLDMSRAIAECEADVLEDPNNKIIHTVPFEYKVDDKKVIGSPIGIKGGTLEVKILFITSANNHFNKLIKVVEAAGVEVDDVFALPMAESTVTISKIQKNAGCVLANIGSEVVTATVFEEGLPRSLMTFKIGCSDITNDIALGLKIPLNEATDIQHGMSVTHLPRGTQKKIQEIINARLSDIFELIDGHLRKLGRSALLPAGIILTGGCTHLENILDVAKDRMKLPAAIAESTPTRITPPQKNGMGHASQSAQKQLFKDRQLIDSLLHPEWSTVYGLCVLGIDSEHDDSITTRMAKNAKQKFVRFIQQFLP